MDCSALPAVGRSALAADLRALPLPSGQIVMLHASVRAVGWIVCGPDELIGTILDCLGPAGTLMMYAAWEERPEHFNQ